MSVHGLLILPLTGTIDSINGKFCSHLHMSAGDGQGHVVGGHLNRAAISATCEMAVRVLPGAPLQELKDVMGKKRAFIVTDSFLYKNGYTKPITDKLDEMGIVYTTLDRKSVV